MESTALLWLADMAKKNKMPVPPAEFTPEVVRRLVAISQANNEPLPVTIVNMVIRGLDSLEAAKQD